MINISSEFARQLYNDNRNYETDVHIKLHDGTELKLRKDKIWSSSFKLEDSVSGDSDLDIGGVVINQFSVSINNIYDEFSDYDFTDAIIKPYVGLELDAGREMLQKGVFIANEVSYNGSLINIKALDYMSKLDKDSSSSTMPYPATLKGIVSDVCRNCDVELATTTFPNSDFWVQERPNDKSTTFRELLCYAVQIAGCFARFNRLGKLEIKWFDTSNLDWDEDVIDGGLFDEGYPRYITGDSIDGGSFNPWNNIGDYDGGAFGDRKYIHFISSTTSFDLGVDDIVITGVRVSAKTKVDAVDGDAGQAKIIKSQIDAKKAYYDSKIFRYNSKINQYTIKINRLATKKNRSEKQQRRLDELIALRQATENELHAFENEPRWDLRNNLASLYSTYSNAVIRYGEDSPEAQAALANLVTAYNNAKGELELEDLDLYVSEREATVSYLAGDEGYVIEISDNPFITEFNAEEVAYFIADELVGLTYRRGTVTHQNDPSIEAGDVAIVWDRKGNKYPILVTSTNFSVGSTQTTRSAGATPARKSATQFDPPSKSWVDTWEEVVSEKTDREELMEKMSEYIASKAGLYFTKVEGDTGFIYYLHDQPYLESSSIVWKMNAYSMSVSLDGGKTYTLALNCDGEIIAQRLSAVGIDAGWIHTGKILVQDPRTRQVTFSADYATGKVVIVADEFSLSGGRQLEAIDPSARSDLSSALTKISGLSTNVSSLSTNLSSVSGTANTALNKANSGYNLANSVNNTINTRSQLLAKVFSTLESDGIYLIDGKLAIKSTALKSCAISADYLESGIIKTSAYYSNAVTPYSSSASSGLQINNGLITFYYNATTTSRYTVGAISCKTDISGASSNNRTLELKATSGNLLLDAQYNVNIGTGSASLVRLGDSLARVVSPAINSRTSSTAANMVIENSGDYKGLIRKKSGSSRRWKHDIVDIQGDLDPHKLYNLPVRQFKFNVGYLDTNDLRFMKDIPGFIAEEVDEFYPIAADKDELNLPCDWNERMIVPPMLALIKEQHEEIEELKRKNEEYEERISRLEDLISKL